MSDFDVVRKAIKQQTDYDVASAALDALNRIESLQREADEIIPILTEHRDRAWAENARLRGALELIAAPKRADGTYNRSREACEAIARAALEGKES